jgi:hypothetical protein
MRHLTLVMAALAICAVTTADLRDTSPAPPLPVFADQEPRPDPVHRPGDQAAVAQLNRNVVNGSRRVGLAPEDKQLKTRLWP